MRSETSEPSARRQRSLLARVAWSSALLAAVGSAVTGLSGGLFAIALISERQADLLHTATMRFANEIEEEESEGKSVKDALEDELGDLDYVDSLGAVHVDGTVIAGDPLLSPHVPGTCTKLVLDDGEYRSCTVLSRGREITLAIATSQTDSLQSVLIAATLISILVGVLSGALLGGLTTRWGLRPFERLGDQVRRIRPDAPDVATLGQPADYAEIEALRVAVSELVDRLGISLRHAQRFAASTSHELRTPLTVIAGDLDLLIESADPVHKDELCRVRARVGALSNLVERLLALAVPWDGRAGEAVDLADTATAVVAALSQAQRDRITLELEEDVLVEGDPTLLGIALTNAVDNSLKFSAGPVAIVVAGDGETARIDVIDRGPGIAVPDRDRVFQPLYRASAVARDRVPGSGLGLALVSHVVRAHGGTARFLDADRGAHLRIELPRWNVAARAPETT